MLTTIISAIVFVLGAWVGRTVTLIRNQEELIDQQAGLLAAVLAANETVLVRVNEYFRSKEIDVLEKEEAEAVN